MGSTERSNALVPLGMRIKEIDDFVTRLLGDKDAIIPIQDERGVASAQENLASMDDVQKKIEEIFEADKKAAYAEWKAIVAEENSWLDVVKKIKKFVFDQVQVWNDKVREADRIRRQKEADEEAAREQKKKDDEAAADKARLDALKEEALKAGDKESAAKFEEEKQNVVAERVVAAPVAEIKVMNRSAVGTISEKRVVLELRITNQLNFINALIGSGYGGILIVDQKTLTAFEKILIQNEESMKEFPGAAYRFGYAPITRKK